MLDNIETYLFKDDGQHGLTKLVMTTDVLEITIAPWDDEKKAKVCSFDKFKLSYISTEEHDLEEFAFPWDIIAVDAKMVKKGKWHFCIHCASVEITFFSEWPQLTQPY